MEEDIYEPAAEEEGYPPYLHVDEEMAADIRALPRESVGSGG